MRRWFSHMGIVLIVSVALVACSGDDESDETTTSTTAAPVTSIGTTQPSTSTTAVTSTEGTSPTTTTTTAATSLGGVDFPTYSITERIAGSAGDTLVILIDPDFDDGTITDIDLQNLLSEVVEDFAPVREAYVVSSEEAAGIVLLENLSSDQEAVLDQHFWARLEEGFRIIFQGPFESAQPLLISS